MNGLPDELRPRDGPGGNACSACGLGGADRVHQQRERGDADGDSRRAGVHRAAEDRQDGRRISRLARLCGDQRARSGGRRRAGRGAGARGGVGRDYPSASWTTSSSSPTRTLLRDVARRILAARASDPACVIVEPILGSVGFVPRRGSGRVAGGGEAARHRVHLGRGRKLPSGLLRCRSSSGSCWI